MFRLELRSEKNNMTSQLYYFSNPEGEGLIRALLLDTFSECYAVNRYDDDKIIICHPEDFDAILLTNRENNRSRQLYLCPSHLIETCYDNRLYHNPIIEYVPSYTTSDGIYCSGWISFYASDKFPEITKKIQSLFRKIKKRSWRDSNYTYWVFNISTSKLTAFIPNREVVLIKNS